MNLSEFKQKIDQIAANENTRHNQQELVVCVRTEGLSGSKTEVTGLGVGFDWDQGAIVVSTKEPVNTWGLKYISKLQSALLKEISVITRNIETKTFKAKYRKQIKAFETESAAQLWLYDNLREEMGGERYYKV